MKKVQASKTIKLSLFAITWPIFIELFLQSLMGSTDTFMLSSISDNAVAAVGVANQLVFFTILLFGFIGTGTAVVVSQLLGAGKPLEAKQVSAISLTINLLLGLIVSGAVVAFRGQFLKLFNLTPDIAELASQYLLIVGGTLFTQALMVTAGAILRANGFTRDVMFISIFMNVIHLIGNSIFIYGLGIGIEGVAVSTAISRFIAFVLAMLALYRRLPIRIEKVDYFNINGSHIKKILNIGMPAAGEQLSYNTSQMTITAIISLLGSAELATRVYTWNIMSFIMLFGAAVGQGTQIIIGHKVGAGDYQGASKQLNTSLRWSMVITILIAIVISFFREGLIGIFTDDPVIIAQGSKLLLLCLVLEPGRTINIVVVNSLRATGDAAFTLKIGLVSMWGVAVAFSYVLGIKLGLGLSGVWIAFIMDEWLRGIVNYFRWKSSVWQRKVLVKPSVSVS